MACITAVIKSRQSFLILLQTMVSEQLGCLIRFDIIIFFCSSRSILLSFHFNAIFSFISLGLSLDEKARFSVCGRASDFGSSTSSRLCEKSQGGLLMLIKIKPYRLKATKIFCLISFFQ